MQPLDIQSPTVRRNVREEIQRRILSGESRPGERVAQQSLAKELGVGQGSLTAARCNRRRNRERGAVTTVLSGARARRFTQWLIRWGICWLFM